MFFDSTAPRLSLNEYMIEFFSPRMISLSTERVPADIRVALISSARTSLDVVASTLIVSKRPLFAIISLALTIFDITCPKAPVLAFIVSNTPLDTAFENLVELTIALISASETSIPDVSNLLFTDPVIWSLAVLTVLSSKTAKSSRPPL